jgi:hypothetical protein
MIKEIKVVDNDKKILQVTSADERWYIRDAVNPISGLPIYEYVPSVTWICESYPKGIGFYKWLANKGWDEAEALKVAAGDKGSKVHQAIAMLIDGATIKIEDKLTNPTTGLAEDTSFEEYEAILSFADWFNKTNPQIIAREFVVWGDGYAGTVDFICVIDGVKWLIDFKTSQYIWPSHELQVSAYKKAYGDENIKLGILQLGYKLNKNKFKLTEIDYQYNEFLAAKLIWAKENKNVQPKQKDYPLSISLNIKKEEQDAKRK